MCFSASASFIASATLTVGGIACIKKAKRREEIPFAAIPFLFGAQQFAEGVLWVALTNPSYSYLQEFSTYSFLIFAQVLWPLWVPLSIMLMEPDAKKKKVLRVLTVVGISISVYLIYCFIAYPVHSSTGGHHIAYVVDFPHKLPFLSGLIYFIPTVIPAFVSSAVRMKLLGTMSLISMLITVVFFHEHLASVWCFFAAAISLVILSIVGSQKKDPGIQMTDLSATTVQH